MISLQRKKTIVYIVYNYEYTRVLFTTGVKVPDAWWKNANVKTGCPNEEDILRTIETKRAEVSNVLNQLIARKVRPYAAEVKAMMNPDLGIINTQIVHPFVDLFRKYIAYKKETRTWGYVKNLYLCLSYLEKYEAYSGNRLDVVTFNDEVFREWVLFMLTVKIKDSKEELSDQTVYTHARILKRFLGQAFPQNNYSYVKYVVPAVDDIIYLYESELIYLKDFPLPEKGFMDKVRDLFVFCALTGMRYSDSQVFDPSWVENGVLEFRQLKTGGRATPPLFKASELILKKWDGIPPRISNQKYNDHLKELFEHMEMSRQVTVSSYYGGSLVKQIQPLYKVIASHMARKTFIMMCIAKEIPIQDIMHMSGHAEYHSIRPYITVSKQHIKDVSSKWDI